MDALGRRMFLRGLAMPTLAGIGSPFVRARNNGDARTAPYEKAIAELNGAARQLKDTVTRYHNQLDEAIAHFGRGSAAAIGHQTPGADTGMEAGTVEMTQAVVRKLFAARVVTVSQRDAAYSVAFLDELDRIQDQMRKMPEFVDRRNAVMRQGEVISVKDPMPADQWKRLHKQWMQALSGIEQQVKTARAALPLERLQSDVEKGWMLLLNGLPAMPLPQQEKTRKDLERARQTPTWVTPGCQIVLLDDAGTRVLLTYSGLDRRGRHLFLQEKLTRHRERASSPDVVWERRRVTVDPVTGQHSLVKNYPLIVSHTGDLDEAAASMGERYRLWQTDPPADSEEPSADEVMAVIAELADQRGALLAALRAIRGAAAAIQGEAFDGNLPVEMRQNLAAIRGCAAGVETLARHEASLRKAEAASHETIQKLEPLAAWASRATTEESTRLAAREWDRLQIRAEDEIYATRCLKKQSWGLYGERLSPAWTEFAPPAADRYIVRLRRLSSTEGAQFLQDVWERREHAGENHIYRTLSQISVDPRTGRQRLLRIKSGHHIADDEESLRKVFQDHPDRPEPATLSLATH